MQNFGNLPHGEIPEPLKYVRPFDVTTTSNGIRVCTEYWKSPIAAVGIFIGAGSRHETLETSGAAHFLEHLSFKGTKSRTRYRLETEIENMGAQLNAYTSREHTLFHTVSFKNDTSRCVEILGDMVSNSLYDKGALEAERDTIWAELQQTNDDYMECLMENVYYNIYREHMMGQPILGDIDNINCVNRDMVQDFYHQNYFGENIVVVGTGDIPHHQLVDLVEQHFHTIPKQTNMKRNSLEKPIYNPGLMMIRDDEMVNSNVGVFYDAPSWKHEDFYGFLLLQRIFGSYQVDKHAEHLNDVKKQYNSMHVLLGELVDVTKAECIYSPYDDCGIFGHYLFGNEVFTRQMNYCGVCLPTIYSHYVNDVEVIRGKNKIYNELCSIESTTEVLQQIGPQMLYLNRRIPKSEIASRIAHIDNYHIKNLCYEWFYDAEPSFTNWGPIEGVSHAGSYKYFKVNTMSTVMNTHHTLFT